MEVNEVVIDSCVVDYCDNKPYEIDACTSNEANEEESSLNIEQISDLLDKEYQRHVDKNGSIFFQLRINPRG